jgi:hypothetical protein
VLKKDRAFDSPRYVLNVPKSRDEWMVLVLDNSGLHLFDEAGGFIGSEDGFFQHEVTSEG